MEIRQTEALTTLGIGMERASREALGYVRAGDDNAANARLADLEDMVKQGQAVGGLRFDRAKATTAVDTLRREMAVERGWRDVQGMYEQGATPTNMTERYARAEAWIATQGFDEQQSNRLKARLKDRMQTDAGLVRDAELAEDKANQNYVTQLLVRLGTARALGQSTDSIMAEAQSRLSERAMSNFTGRVFPYLVTQAVTPENQKFFDDTILSIRYGEPGRVPSAENIEQLYSQGRFGVPGSMPALSARRQALEARENVIRQQGEIDSQLHGALRVIETADNDMRTGAPMRVDRETLMKAHETVWSRGQSITVRTPQGERSIKIADPQRTTLMDENYRSYFYGGLAMGFIPPAARTQLEQIADPGLRGTPEQVFALARMTIQALDASNQPGFHNGFNPTDEKTLRMRAAATRYLQIAEDPSLQGQENQQRMDRALQEVRTLIGAPPPDEEVQKARVRSFLSGLGDDIRPSSQTAAGRFVNTLPGVNSLVGRVGAISPDMQMNSAISKTASVIHDGSYFGGSYVGGQFLQQGGLTERLALSASSFLNDAFGAGSDSFVQLVMTPWNRPTEMNVQTQNNLRREIKAAVGQDLIRSDAEFRAYVASRTAPEPFHRDNMRPEFKQRPTVTITDQPSLTAALGGDSEAAAIALYRHISSLQRSQSNAIPAAPEQNYWMFWKTPQDLLTMIKNGDVAVEPVTQLASGRPAMANGEATFNVWVRDKEGFPRLLPGTMSVRALTESERQRAIADADERVRLRMEQTEQQYRAEGINGFDPGTRAFFGVLGITTRAAALADLATRRETQADEARNNPVTLGQPRRQ